jgi:hypothetical protein
MVAGQVLYHLSFPGTLHSLCLGKEGGGVSGIWKILKIPTSNQVPSEIQVSEDWDTVETVKTVCGDILWRGNEMGW